MSLERRLAWRNVWRNKRRTALCVAATVFAVALVVLSLAMQMGTHEKMIEDGVRLRSGHVTIAAPGSLKERTLEQFIVPDAAILRALEADPRVVGFAPRIAGSALVSYGSASRGAMILGVDPAREGDVTTLPSRVSEGRFVAAAPGAREIVLGRSLADALSASIGDEVLLYGIAYSLETAYELFEVVGLVALPNRDLERSLAVVALPVAQQFYVYGDRLSEIAVRTASADDAGPVADALRASFGGAAGPRGAHGVAFYRWDEVMPDLANLLRIDRAGMYIVLVILIVVVAFGILNTILMAILERTRELGMMLALGLRPGALFRMVYWESLFMAGLGLAIGLAVSVPLALYLAGHPIPLSGEELSGTAEIFGMEPVVTFALKPRNPIGSAIAILVVGALAALYPAVKASRSRAVDALRTT